MSKIFKLLLPFLIAGTYSRSYSQTEKLFWVDLGIGTGTENFQTCAGLALNVGTFYGKLQAQETQTFYSSEHFTSTSYGVLLGKFRPGSERQLYYGAGLSRMVFLSENKASMERKATPALGIPVELVWIFRHRDHIGIGLRLNGNINTHTPYLGAGLILPIGKLN